MQAPLSRENMIRGVILFTIFTLAGLFLSFIWSGTQDIKSGAEELGRVFQEMRYEYLLIVCVFTFLDWLCAGLRFHVFIRVVSPTMKFRDSFRAILSTICVSAITPFQTGGVGHLYIYSRAGAPLSGAITAGIAAFLSTLVVLIVAAGGILWIDPSSIPKETTWISFFSFLIFSIVFLVFVLLLLKPDLILRIFQWLCDHVGKSFPSISSFLERAKLKVEQLSNEHKSFAITLLREHKWRCVLSLLLTCGFFAARIIGGYFVIKAFGEEVSLWNLCVVEMLYNFVVLFAPTPGASGFAELAKDRLMTNLIAAKYITPFVLLTRFFAIYIAVVLGGIVISMQIAKDIRHNKKEIAKDAIQQV